MVHELAKALGVTPAFSEPVCDLVYPSSIAELTLPAARPNLAVLVENKLAELIDADCRGVDPRARRAPERAAASTTSPARCTCRGALRRGHLRIGAPRRTARAPRARLAARAVGPTGRVN